MWNSVLPLFGLAVGLEEASKEPRLDLEVDVVELPKNKVYAAELGNNNKESLLVLSLVW